MTPEDGAAGDLLTIAEAADRLRVTERRLRHLLARPEYAASIRQTTRRTKSGTRRAAGILPDTLARLQAELSAIPSENNAAGRGGEDAAQDGDKAVERSEDGGEDAASAGRDTAKEVLAGQLPAAVYQKLLADKDGEIAYLREALRMAQENLGREQQNRAREQTLRALPGPDGGEQEGGEQSAAAGAQAVRPGWWARLWSRGK